LTHPVYNYIFIYHVVVYNSTQRGSMDAGVKHLDIHICLVTQLYTNITIHLFHVLIYRRFRSVVSCQHWSAHSLSLTCTLQAIGPAEPQNLRPWRSRLRFGAGSAFTAREFWKTRQVIYAKLAPMAFQHSCSSSITGLCRKSVDCCLQDAGIV